METNLYGSLPRLVTLPDAVPETRDWPELSAASEIDLSALDANDTRWLTVATTHRSALYEQAATFPGISPVCLTLLESAGSDTFSMEFRRAIMAEQPNGTASQFDTEFNRTTRIARQLLSGKLDTAAHAILGKGEASSLKAIVDNDGSPRTLETVLLQVVGWWSLMASCRNLRQFAHAIYREASDTLADDITAIDVNLVFHKVFDACNPEYQVNQKGPDNNAVFEAYVRTSDGRSGVGSGKSKKNAQQSACLDYLQKYAPSAIADHRGSLKAARRPSTRLRLEGIVDARYERLAADFGCPDAFPFARALVHRSWSYEEIPGSDTNIDSNAPLAHLGSRVVGATLARYRAAIHLSRTMDPDPESASPKSMPSAALRGLFDSLGLRPLARLGAGQRLQGFPDEMAADMVQATLAAAHIQWPDQPSFERALPPAISQFMATWATRSLTDPATRLQQLTSELGLPFEDSSSRAGGPDHKTVFQSTLKVGDGPHDVMTGTGSSKTAAKLAAAARAVAAIRPLLGDSGSSPNLAFARSFTRRFIEALPSTGSAWPRWQRAGYLGVHLLMRRDFEAFTQWATGLEQLLGRDWHPSPSSAAALSSYYNRIYQPDNPRPLFRAELDRAARWAAASAQADVSALSGRSALPDFAPLSAAQSIWLTQGDAALIAGILDDWELLNRRRLPIDRDADPEGFRTDGRSAAALLKILQECTADLLTASPAQVTVKVRTTGDRCLVVLGCPEHSFSGLPDSLVIRLLCEAAPGIKVAAPAKNAIGISVPAAQLPQAGEGWLTAAARPRPVTDDYEQSMATLIHDLKNEVTAARVALDQPSASRTEQLAAQHAASEHLDRVADLGSRLRAADLLYSAVDLVGITDLAPFLQAYSSDQIRRLPQQVRLVPPTLTPASVAIEERALRAILDNLLINAQEAIPESGTIIIEYASFPDDYRVLLEVANSGPLIPDSVIVALQSGQPIASAKRSGSGLGLLGIRRILRRVGGDLEAANRSGGPMMLVTLPLVTDDPEEDEESL